MILRTSELEIKQISTAMLLIKSASCRKRTSWKCSCAWSPKAASPKQVRSLCSPIKAKWHYEFTIQIDQTTKPVLESA